VVTSEVVLVDVTVEEELEVVVGKLVVVLVVKVCDGVTVIVFEVVAVIIDEGEELEDCKDDDVIVTEVETFELEFDKVD
jgi:hypothetical protein